MPCFIWSQAHDHYILLVFIFTFHLCVYLYCIFHGLIFIAFIEFLIWKEILVDVKGMKSTGSDLVISNNSRPMLLLVWPSAGSPRCWAARLWPRGRKAPELTRPSGLSIPSHPRARPGQSSSHGSLLQPPGLAFVPPDPVSPCAREKGLCVNTVIPSVTVGTPHPFNPSDGGQSHLCVLFCLSFKLPDLFGLTWLYF